MEINRNLGGSLGKFAILAGLVCDVGGLAYRRAVFTSNLIFSFLVSLSYRQLQPRLKFQFSLRFLEVSEMKVAY